MLVTCLISTKTGFKRFYKANLPRFHFAKSSTNTKHDVWCIFVMCSIISRSEEYWGTFRSLEFTYCLLSALIQSAPPPTLPLGHINWVIIKQGPEKQKCKTFGKPDGSVIVPLLIRHILVQWRTSTDFFGCINFPRWHHFLSLSTLLLIC